MYQLRFRMNIQSYSDRPHLNTCIYSVNGLQNPYSHLDNTHVFNPSKPFVITALNMLIIGSMIGSIWMMTIYGVILPAELISTIHLHKLLQFDGFITMIIMGIGYLIVPHFWNVSIPSIRLVYVSYGLILVSVIFSITVSSSGIPQLIYTIGSSLASDDFGFQNVVKEVNGNSY